MALARMHLQRMAEVRLGEAQVLLEAGHHSGAYYMAGYVIELALKACIAKQFKAEVIPDWKFFKDARTHKFPELVALGGLDVALAETRSADAQFDAYWTVAANWTVDSRYDDTSDALASQLIEAIGDPAHGVLQWIRIHW